jgi:predicted anti-sigma-YlaC factor YlaD
MARRLHLPPDMSTAYQQIVRRRRIALRFEKFFLAAVGIITTATLTVVF